MEDEFTWFWGLNPGLCAYYSSGHQAPSLLSYFPMPFIYSEVCVWRSEYNLETVVCAEFMLVMNFSSASTSLVLESQTMPRCFLVLFFFFKFCFISLCVCMLVPLHKSLSIKLNGSSFFIANTGQVCLPLPLVLGFKGVHHHHLTLLFKIYYLRGKK